MYYVSQNKNEFQPDDLIENLTCYLIYTDGTESEGFTISDFSIISCDGQTPESIFTAQNEPFCRTSIVAQITNPISDNVTDVQEISIGDVWIGVKGDATLNGTVNQEDASTVLEYYTASISFNTDTIQLASADAEIERFAAFLADVNAPENTIPTVSKSERQINAIDAQSILVFYVKKMAGSSLTDEEIWEEILNN